MIKCSEKKIQIIFLFVSIIISITYGLNLKPISVYNQKYNSIDINQENLNSADTGSDSAPKNLTSIVVEKTEATNKALNNSIDWFRSEWKRVFNSAIDLPILTVDLELEEGGLELDELELINNSLLVGMARNFIGFSWYEVENATEIVRCEWNNDTYGQGWAIYGNDTAVTNRALAFYASILNKFKSWDENYLDPRFSYLIGVAPVSITDDTVDSWQTTLASFEDNLKQLNRRCFTGLQMLCKLENICNISLPGYEEPNHDEIYDKSIEMLKTYIDLAANYSLKIYLYTDELVLTQAQYTWLINNLNYDGPAQNEDFPDHLSGESPGLWTFLEAKYQAIVDSLQLILNDNNKAGFGGFYFRIDDLSNPYPYKYSVLTPLPYLQRFINITTAAAEQLDATVIQRMWILGEGENTFNNATLAKELLDPIQATNLVLRCKETWNDHWYNHPPNPIIGVSHHPWIIGWYAGAAMPDYKGQFFDDFYNNAGWLENPNVVGYDLPGLCWSAFSRMDYNPFVSANHHYLFMKMFYGNMNGNDTLEWYFNQIGLGDQPTIDILTEIFNDVHEAFRLQTFWMAWSTSGKFTGDILNGGNTVLFEPGRFNQFYAAVRKSQYNIEYTINEGYLGRDIAIAAFNKFPKTFEGKELPALTDNYLDPEYATDPTNMTEILLTLRGNLRQFADFSRIFAPYRAWHLTFYYWGETGSLLSWIRSEKYRNEILSEYAKYMEIWGNTHYWYQVNFDSFEDFWLPLVGQTQHFRYLLIFNYILLIGGICMFVFIFRNHFSISMKHLVLGNRIGNFIEEHTSAKKRDLSKDSEKEEKIIAVDVDINKHYYMIRLIISMIILPIIILIYYILFFNALVVNLYPEIIVIAFLLGSFEIAVPLSVIILCIPTKSIRQLLNKGIGSSITYIGFVLTQIPWLIIITMGGIFVLTASKFLLVIMLISLLIGFLYNYISLFQNLGIKNPKRIVGFTLLLLIVAIGVFSLLTLSGGGPIEMINTLIDRIESL